jgi:hypothetical protein
LVRLFFEGDCGGGDGGDVLLWTAFDVSVAFRLGDKLVAMFVCSFVEFEHGVSEINIIYEINCDKKMKLIYIKRTHLTCINGCDRKL